MRRPGRAVRARVRRPASQSFLRRRPGVAHLLLPRPDRPAAPARRLPGPVPPDRRGKRHMYPRTEMLDLVVVDGQAHGIVTRDLVTGKIESFVGDAVVLATGGYGSVLPFHQRQALQRHGDLPRLQARRLLRQPVLHADPPDLHPAYRRSPVEADADVGVAAQRRPRLGAEEGRRQAAAQRRSPRRSAITIWSGNIRASAISRRGTCRRGPPRRFATRAAASARAAAASTSISPTPSGVSARRDRERYSNLFDMYAHITHENPYQTPMRIYPAVHYAWAACGWTTS